MLRLRDIGRGLHIIGVLLRYALRPQVCGRRHPLLQALAWLNPYSWASRQASAAQLLRHMLVALGPIFVKFGQQLSTRRDLLPPDIANELALLQDQVPPIAGKQAVKCIERALGQPVAKLFAEFCTEPLASASIAQVHAARLLDGREVVVKVLRPQVRRQIKRDIRLMYLAAGVLTKLLGAVGRRLSLCGLVREFELTTMDELDLQYEAANAVTLRRNFADSTLLYVPEIYWPYVRSEVLVQERIYGIAVSDIAALKAQGTDLKKLAEAGVEIFFTQVFRDSFFHADMHPGNIFVSREHPHEPQYIGVDFGIMGSLTPQDQYYIAENLLAFFQRDYRRVAQLHIDSGWVDANARLDRFEAAIRTVCEPIFEKPLEDISFAKLLLRLFQTAQRFKMTVQPQLMLLQKTLFNVEGLGRELYPQLNLWDTAQPFLQRFVELQRGPWAQLKQAAQRLPQLLDATTRGPELGVQVLTQLQERMRVGGQCTAGPESRSAAARRGRRRWLWRGGLLGAGLLWLWLASAYHSISPQMHHLWQQAQSQLLSMIAQYGVWPGVGLVLLAGLWPRHKN